MLEEDAVALKKTSITALAPSSLRLENTTKCLEDYAKENHNDDDDDVDVNADGDSYGSMETLSDTVSITIDGEKHWVSGIDAQTTCADLISALLQYQDLEGKQLGKHQGNQISMQTKEEQAQQRKQEASGLKNSHAYVIVKQLRHCNFEEYLDGSTRLLDVVPLRDSLGKKVCELQLRNLARTTTTTTATAATTVTAATPALLSSSRGGKNPTQNPQNQHHNQMFSMLSMSTDKDSGMGSPMGSSRSERFRRRRDRGKATRGSVAATVATTVATTMVDVVDDGTQANPKQVNPNERLMHIILAQDETINRQMSLLNEKEQQILQIEDEKHRVRERELGKNYLLDAYLKTMDKPVDAGEEQHNRQRIPKLAKAELGNSSHLPDDMQIYWLEKVYALNKLLQREEEQLLRLHAKVRKQQLRHAYHTKGEVLQQIDRLDTELAEQVTDIYRVERQLLTANEQLKAKLGVLECLGKEFEVPQEIAASSTSMQHYRASIEKQDDVVWHQNCRQNRLDKDLTRKQMFGTVDQPVRSAAISSSMDIQHLGTLV